MTFPASMDQTPRPAVPGLDSFDASELPVAYVEGSDVGYRWFARTEREPLFPFGFGLSYTSFHHGEVRLARDAGGIVAELEVTNVGKVAGADVVQLYVVGRDEEAMLRLAAFERVELAAGESRTVTLIVEPRVLADWRNGGWSKPQTSLTFAVGRSAAQLDHGVRIGVDS